MSMSRKQYRDIADVLNTAWNDLDNMTDDEIIEVRGTLALVISGLSTVFEIDNPRFNRQRFQLACTKSPEVTE